MALKRETIHYPTCTNTVFLVLLFVSVFLSFSELMEEFKRARNSVCDFYFHMDVNILPRIFLEFLGNEPHYIICSQKFFQVP
jgi:hypothetical protein